MATTRVYILADELGVKSSAIIKKCQAEGLDIKNHMSVISAGLAATIREWFSEEENVTTIETTDKVDLKKARVKKKPKQKRPVKEEAEKEEGGSAGPAVAVAGEPAAEVAPAEVKPAEIKPAETVVVAAKEPPKPAEKPVVEKPKKPEPVEILPAGPMLERPEPARLAGPRVVRIEAPEPLPPPRSKLKPRFNAPVTEPLIPDDLEGEQGLKLGTKDKKRPPKPHKEKGRVRRPGEVEEEAARRHKFVEQRRQRDMEERRARLDAAGGEGLRVRPIRKIATKAHTTVAAPVRPAKATVSEPITIKNLSAAFAVKSADIISRLMEQGTLITANQVISSEVAELIAMELGTELTIEHKAALEEQIHTEFDQRARNNLSKRSVVATMLGHVDHGKTSLLDKIRSTNVTASEAGGITQHIGAYQVGWGSKKVTFLDTPGHEAFTAMRARGANMADVVVLVVAADDGVMPQTVEAMHHAKAANVPVIVALNKIDLPGCDVNRIYSQLAENDLAPVEWSGKTEVVKTSAITGQGISDLLEHLDYVAELLELKADDTIPATGWVVEAKVSATRGTVATLLIKEGCLKKGDAVLAGCAYGRVKSIKNSFGKSIKTATSSMPVEVTGLTGVPLAGDRFYCLDDINKAKAAAEESQVRSRERMLVKRTQITLDNLFSQIAAGNIKELNVIIRADVQGSVDVLTKYLSELSNEQVKVRILHSATGGITEGDVVLAEASNAIIIGFNVIVDDLVAKMAEVKGVDIRLYTIIYRITEDLQKSMVGLLEPEEQERPLGRATVRNIFKVSKVGTVAGCYVNDGIVRKNAKVRLIRNNIIVRGDLTIESLKHFKDDAREVKADMECGIKIAKFDDIKIDDVFGFYEIVKVAGTLSAAKGKSEN
jgi:translation initiation factor IF-2